MFRRIYQNLSLVCFACFSSAPTAAEEIEVSYKSFYGHVRKLNNEDTRDLQFSFGFMHIQRNELCKLNKVYISTQKQQIPLQITDENRFAIQSEKALNLADAKVLIDIADKANQCDMSVQLETKPKLLKETYSKSELMNIYSQYQSFFNEMGSFLSFMMPTVSGLRLQFHDEDLSTTLPSGHRIISGMLSLKDDDIDKIGTLYLPSTPLRITAIATK